MTYPSSPPFLSFTFFLFLQIAFALLLKFAVGLFSTSFIADLFIASSLFVLFKIPRDKVTRTLLVCYIGLCETLTVARIPVAISVSPEANQINWVYMTSCARRVAPLFRLGLGSFRKQFIAVNFY